MTFDLKKFLSITRKKLAVAAILFILFAPCLQTTVYPPCAPPIPGQPASECPPVISHYSVFLFAIGTLPYGGIFLPDILFGTVIVGALVSYLLACALVHVFDPMLIEYAKSRKKK